MSEENKKEEKAEGSQEEEAGKREAAEAGEKATAPEDEAALLMAELEAKANEARENYDRFLRASADLDNYKKRVEREKAELVNFSNEGLITELLPVMDNLQRALEHSNAGHNNIESLREGVRLTIEQMLSTFKKSGVEEIKAEGERFDPALHHAISHDEAGDGPEVVVKELQKGYLLKGRLLRPSMVAVARKPAMPN